MMGIFGSKLVDKDVLEWQFDWYTWLIENFSSGAGLPDSELWLPTTGHFGHSRGFMLEGQSLARFVFKRIKEQCRFSPQDKFKLRIISTPQGGNLGGVAHVTAMGNRACGTYQVKETEQGTYQETITISEDLIDNPTNLIATMAHELSHALHNRAKEVLDIEPELYELFTDLTAIYLGYGIFLANSRFEFSQFSNGEIRALDPMDLQG